MSDNRSTGAATPTELVVGLGNLSERAVAAGGDLLEGRPGLSARFSGAAARRRRRRPP